LSKYDRNKDETPGMSQELSERQEESVEQTYYRNIFSALLEAKTFKNKIMQNTHTSLDKSITRNLFAAEIIH
jgi:hypothetical protein